MPLTKESITEYGVVTRRAWSQEHWTPVERCLQINDSLVNHTGPTWLIKEEYAPWESSNQFFKLYPVRHVVGMFLAPKASGFEERRIWSSWIHQVWPLRHTFIELRPILPILCGGYKQDLGLYKARKWYKSQQRNLQESIMIKSAWYEDVTTWKKTDKASQAQQRNHI